MRDILVRIKRAVLAGRYAFSEKARTEMEADRLTESDVAESIINAVAIYKRPPLAQGAPLSSDRVPVRHPVHQLGGGDGILQREAHYRGRRGPILLPRVLEEGVVMAQPKGTFRISACPACGSAGIRAVQQDWSGSYAGKRYVVRNLRYFRCPQCGEKVYDPSAMRRIQAASPAFGKLQ